MSPSWLPTIAAPVDLMHNLFGTVAHFHTKLVTKGYLLDKKLWDHFEEVLNNICWPSRVGQLPWNMGENHSLEKADEWRRHAAILPFVLWECWKDENDEIPCVSQVSIPAKAKYKPKFTRNPKKNFQAALLLSVACKLLTSQSH
ncbi:hypothetical protein K439DRAFT_1620514 [Ramaria rubella]|nr:hypothetical protein K439DRAFT_1620514 [Ramaria rubella]